MSSDRRRRTRRTIGVSLVVATVANLALLVAYWSDAGPQAEGVALATAFGALAVAAGVWGRRGVPGGVEVEERPPMPSTHAERVATAETASLDDEDPGLGRRRSLLALMGAAGATLLAALASPLRSLGPDPRPERTSTSWRDGRRLVTADGTPIRVDDLDVGGVETAFPDGDAGSADGQVVLVRIAEGELDLPAERLEWAPEGNVAYSKVCTHAGCPVGLFDADTNELLCPCHQSVFRADAGARVTFGPAARPLPQLPVGVDADGYLVALGDFSEPIGPSFWNRP